MKVLLIRVNLMFKTSKSLVRCFPKNSLQNSPRIEMIEVQILNLKRGEILYPPKERSTRGKCGMKHMCEFIFGNNSCYSCGKGFHIVKYCPNLRIQGKGNCRTQPNCPSSETQKRKKIYILKDRG